jgi:hypothetical protein
MKGDRMTAPKHRSTPTLSEAIVREERAERDLERARAAATRDAIREARRNAHMADDGFDDLSAAEIHAEAELAPSVRRAATRLMEARVARRLAERDLERGAV